MSGTTLAPGEECWGFAMDDNGAGYFLNRAEQEERAAHVTSNSLAAQIHRSLAERYRYRARECECNQPLRADLPLTMVLEPNRT